jgi:glutamate N-acetyltransferase/amino-acid N-acetyltransferase
MKKNVTTLKGVYGGGIAAGIKANGKKDLAYLFIPECYGSAGVFTKSAFIAPPLIVTKDALAKGCIKALIVNSGNANAATGKIGLRDARETAKVAAKLLGIKPQEVAVSSTGVIGRKMPMDTVRVGLHTLLKNPHQRNGDDAARAIMTPAQPVRRINACACSGCETSPLPMIGIVGTASTTSPIAFQSAVPEKNCTV